MGFLALQRQAHPNSTPSEYPLVWSKRRRKTGLIFTFVTNFLLYGDVVDDEVRCSNVHAATILSIISIIIILLLRMWC